MFSDSTGLLGKLGRAVVLRVELSRQSEVHLVDSASVTLVGQSSRGLVGKHLTWYSRGLEGS